ncbi:MAG TPA: protein translocase subunit SecF [Anaerolineae bacterium]
MFHIVENRKWYFLLSALVIIPGLIAMIYTMAVTPNHVPFKLAIDFTGGALWELTMPQASQAGDVRAVFVSNGQEDTAVTMSGDGKTAIVRTKTLSEDARATLLKALQARFPGIKEESFSSVGPSIGNEVTNAALLAVIGSSLVILLFLVIAFRRAPNPIRYGVTAIIASLHDLLVTLGVFSILSLVLGWEADALFLTAVLTVIGFSVQDTIVVFDRIRENLAKHRGEKLSRVVNRSLLETLHRSVAIHLTALFVLVAILIFGGSTIKPFIATLLIGVTTGTYSSIFNASQLLVGWEEGDWLGLHAQVPAAERNGAQPQTAA